MYDESMWDSWEWLEPWTTIDNMMLDSSCPSCWGSMEDFQKVEEEILYAEIPERKEAFEMQHIPFVEFLGSEKIKVKVWEVEHSMEEEHYVSSIILYDEYGDIIEEKFLTYEQKSEAEFDTSDLDYFEIMARCNLHGLWSTGVMKNV